MYAHTGTTPGSAFPTGPVPALFKTPGPAAGTGTAQQAGRAVPAAPQPAAAGDHEFDDEDEELLAMQADDQWDAAMDVMDEFEAATVAAPPSHTAGNAAAATARTATAMVGSNMPAAESVMPAGSMRSAAPNYVDYEEEGNTDHGAAMELSPDEGAMLQEGGGENESAAAAGSGHAEGADLGNHGNAVVNEDTEAMDQHAAIEVPSQQQQEHEEEEEEMGQVQPISRDVLPGQDDTLQQGQDAAAGTDGNAMQEDSSPMHACDDADQHAPQITQDQDNHARDEHEMDQADHASEQDASGADPRAGVADEAMDQDQDLHDEDDIDAQLLREVAEQEAHIGETPYDPFASQLPFTFDATQPDASQNQG